jgi:hypothetical protein
MLNSYCIDVWMVLNVCVQAEMAAALVKGLEDQESELIERVRQAQVSLSPVFSWLGMVSFSPRI